MRSRKNQIADCVGLWLAEGDSKTHSEVTFTNNSEELIEYFRSIIEGIYNGKNSARVYSYSPKVPFKPPFQGLIVKTYLDRRANKPYYIYRLADVEFVKKWKRLVQECMNNQKLHPGILRGIFAGEGNIKTGDHSSRTLRISQKDHNEEFGRIFKSLNLTYAYSKGNRMYNFTHKENWDIFAKYRIADLHPEKRKLFWQAYLTYKETHYRAHFIRNHLLKLLEVPRTKKWLAAYFNRTGARIYDVLDFFRKNKKIVTYRCGSKNYWIRTDKNSLLISRRKQTYLNALKNGSETTQEIAKELNVGWKASFRRMTELQRLGLVTNEDKRWKLLNCDMKVIVI